MIAAARRRPAPRHPARRAQCPQRRQLLGRTARPAAAAALRPAPPPARGPERGSSARPEARTTAPDKQGSTWSCPPPCAEQRLFHGCPGSRDQYCILFRTSHGNPAPAKFPRRRTEDLERVDPLHSCGGPARGRGMGGAPVTPRGHPAAHARRGGASSRRTTCRAPRAGLCCRRHSFWEVHVQA